MTPEERDRLAKVEQIVSDVRDDLIYIKDTMRKLEGLAHMGKGALGLFLKAGTVLVIIAGAGAWLFDRIHK